MGPKQVKSIYSLSIFVMFVMNDFSSIFQCYLEFYKCLFFSYSILSNIVISITSIFSLYFSLIITSNLCSNSTILFVNFSIMFIHLSVTSLSGLSTFFKSLSFSLMFFFTYLIFMYIPTVFTGEVAPPIQSMPA